MTALQRRDAWSGLCRQGRVPGTCHLGTVSQVTITYTHPRDEMVDYLPATAVSALDVGCSSGAFGTQLRKLSRITRLVGLEPNQEAAEVARSVYDEVIIGRFPDAQRHLPAGERYDAVYFNDVLEHMERPELALAAVPDLLSPTGVIIASIPNIRHVSILGQLIFRDEWRYKESGILDTTHVRFFTARSIRRLFEDGGWDVECLEGINRVLRGSEVRPRLWIRVLGRVTRGWTDGFFFMQYVVVARSRETT
jgi:2-polyprenyl-3-methyl-5-hydroxy-6-metoxy-1,4-benzoquinol methylase